MHLISFDASPKQLSKLRNGHKVRIKKGSGFNLVVNPSNYNLVSRAFARNKGVEINLSPEEIDHNQNMSPEQHEEMTSSMDENLFQHLPFAEGGSIFKRAKKALSSKRGKDIRRALKPAGRAFLNAGKDMAHDQLAQMHMQGSEYVPDNENARTGYNELFNVGHSMVDNTGRKRQSPNYNYNYGMQGYGLGAGMNVHHALKLANLATSNANHQLAKLHNSAVHGMHSSPPIKRYYDDDFAPPSRGTGLHNHFNMIRGRGAMLKGDDILPHALQSQPFGANWHMQFFLPPQYHRYNDGTDVEGRGLYL